MTFNLLKLPDGGLSLEFEPNDRTQLAEAIRNEFGGFMQREAGLAIELTIGGQQFTYFDEWDSPCLIASGSAASAMLRQLYDRLNFESESPLRGIAWSAPETHRK